MTKTSSHSLDQFLSRWIALVQQFRVVIILLTIVGTITSLNYTVNNLGMNTDTRDMLSPDLTWRQLDLEYENEFPHTSDNLLIVIESPTPDQSIDAALLLYKHLQKNNHLFKSIYYPQGLPFFTESALLYLAIEELQDLSDNLASIQPFLAKLTDDQSIRGLFNMLSKALEAKNDGEEINLEPLFKRINQAINAVEQNKPYQLSWHELMSGKDEEDKIYREFITLQPILDYGDFLPAQAAIEKIRQLADELQLNDKNNIRLRLTGSAALSHEELLSISRGTGITVLFALCIVTIIMLVGLGSIWLVIATLLTLIAGLIFTAAFAALTVGELNLISVAFAVLYIGLGVDFAIHLCLRYRELLLKNISNASAIQEAAINVGGSLTLCAITTAIAFYSFIPTDYDGVAELGWISGSGMFISLFITLTVLPALLGLFPQKIGSDNNKPITPGKFENVFNFPIKHNKKIKITGLLLAIVSLLLLPRIYFDHNTLHLQSPDNESVATFFDLLKDSNTPPWSGIILAENKDQAIQIIDELKQLPVVKKIVWLNDFIPDDQEEKLAIIEEMDLLIGDLSATGESIPLDDQGRVQAMQDFTELLSVTEPFSTQEKLLNNNLNKFLHALKQQSMQEKNKTLKTLEHSLLASLPGRIDALSKSLYADTVNIDSLPHELLRHWLSHDNHYLLEIYPTENLTTNSAMQRFVRQLQQHAPQVTGTPVVSIEASKAVIKAFQQAFLYALGAISLLLLLLMKNIRDTLLVLIPLLLAALLTAAVSVILHIPLNFANIIALPLLLGIGVDSAIHIIHRLRSAPPIDGNLLATSSARAVLVSALTTIFSIGNLAFSPHLGTASMGKLLALGITMTLVCSLIILPSLLSGELNRIKNDEKP